jgi:succinate dehydrogenase/fumarate reductase flavoprotein subunit
MRAAQPNYFLPLDKAGVDPFTTAYPIRMIYEGTVRGTGGLRLTGFDCATTVTGLYAAGDAATRELITGSISGGGSHNGAWAIASGRFAGRAAEQFARSTTHQTRRTPVQPADGPNSGIGLRPAARTAPTADDIVGQVQSHILAPQRTFLRGEAQLRSTAQALAAAWDDVAAGLAPMPPRERYKPREAIAMLAAARWITAAALARAESRGMHRRVDHPGTDHQFDTRILTGGLGEVWTRPDPVLPVLLDAEGVA